MFFTFVLVAIFGIVLSKELPTFIPRCRLIEAEHENYEKCIIEAAETLRPYLRKGIPELGMPSIDPLFIPKISLKQGTEAVNMKMKLTNVTVHGFDTYQLKVAKFNFKSLDFYGVAQFNDLSLEADYEMHGKILELYITGKGKTKVLLRGVVCSVNNTGEFVKRNGEIYYHILMMKLKIDFNDVELTFDGLFKENKELAQATEQVLRENSKEIFKEMLPTIEKVSEELLLKVMNGLTKNIPYNKLFITE